MAFTGHNINISVGARPYRLRIYDGNYEVLGRRFYRVELDLYGLGVDHVLRYWANVLTREALAAREHMSHPRLEVCDLVTGAKVMDWAGGA